MPDQVTFSMSADVSQIVRANEQLAASEKKVEQQFTQTARSADQANRQIEQSVRRTATVAQSAAGVAEYGLAPLAAAGAVGAAGADAVRFSSSRSSVRRPRAFSLAPVAVQSAASQMVVERTGEQYEFASEARGRQNLVGMDLLLARANRGLARADERYGARISAEASSALNAGTIAYAAGGGRFEGDNGLRGTARRFVAANVLATSELSGKVSDSELETMTTVAEERLRAADMIAKKVLVVGAVAGAAILGMFNKIIGDMEVGRKKADDFLAGAKGAISLPSFRGQLGDFRKFATGLSNEYGVDVNTTVTPLLEQVGRQAGNLSPDAREQIARQSLRFQQLTGGPAGTFANVLDNIMDVDDSVSPAQAGNLIEFLRTKGGLDIATQQQVLGTLLPTAKAAGIKTEEVAGLSAMLSGMGGPEGQLARGGRGILNRLGVLKKGGFITGKGGLFGAMGELDTLRNQQPDAFDQAMGEVGPLAGPVLSAVLTHRSEYERNVADAKTALTGSGDVLEKTFQNKVIVDDEFRAGIRSEQTRQREANAPLLMNKNRRGQGVTYAEKMAEWDEQIQRELNSANWTDNLRGRMDEVNIIGRRIDSYLYATAPPPAPMIESAGQSKIPASQPSLNFGGQNFLVDSKAGKAADFLRKAADVIEENGKGPPPAPRGPIQSN